MADPMSLVIAAGAATGAAGKIAERVMDVLLPEFRGAGTKAQREAIENALHMLVSMGERLDRMENESAEGLQAAQLLEQELGNADFSYTVRQAVLGAARTNSPVRHEILSRAVVERLIGAPDSIQVVASAQAIEALGKLSGLHLDLLGLAALLYYIGPVLHAPAEIPGEMEGGVGRDEAWFEEKQRLGYEMVEAYVAWLRKQLEPYSPWKSGATSLDYAHLASVSCATNDRNLKRRLSDVLRSPALTRRIATTLHRSYGMGLEVESLGTEDRVEGLRGLWEEGLQHLTLTPAGLLIGCVVHEFRTGEEVRVRWDLAPADAFEDERVWNGRGIDPKFVDAIERQLEQKEHARRRAQGDSRIP